MIKQMIWAGLLSMAMIGASHAQSIFPGGPRFDGTVKIVKVTGAKCPNEIKAALTNQTFFAAYAGKRKPTTNDFERMSIAIPDFPFRGAVFLQAEGDGTFSGNNQKVNIIIVLDAYRDGLPIATANLKFTPANVTATTPSFTFNGTVKNLAFANCTAQIRGNFDKRPNF